MTKIKITKLCLLASLVGNSKRDFDLNHVYSDHQDGAKLRVNVEQVIILMIIRIYIML